MSIRKYAYATVTQPFISHDKWDNIRTASKRVGGPSADLMIQASNILGQQLDPDKFLISHATIVSSVDTIDMQVPLGMVESNGQKINRKYSNFRITPETDIFINNNMDAFDRPVLLAAYNTFIGAQNFQEHLQIESESKGRILDAVARDIGDSVYVDILIATDRRHTQLISDIEKHKLSTLSMGCFLAGTQVHMADGSYKSIETITPGEKVLTHTGKHQEVTIVQIRQGDWDTVSVEVEGCTTIRSTNNHPFFVLRDSSLIEVRADYLHVGDSLVYPLSDGYDVRKVTGVSSGTYSGQVYDLEVDEDHSYVVEGVAVHNCNIESSTCTRCGNVAPDETQMCSCILHYKGNTFYDEQGMRHRIAELCGHKSLENGGVQFIEASWVKNPAFKGAVLRNILQAQYIPSETLKRAQEVMLQPPPQWFSGMSHQAKVAEGLDFGEVEQKDPEPKDPKADPLSQVEDEIYQTLMDRVQQRMKDTINKKPAPPSPEDSTMQPNDNINKEARIAKVAYTAALRSIIKTAASPAQAVIQTAALDQSFGLKLPESFYRTIIKVGTSGYSNSWESYLKTIGQKIGRGLTQAEANHIVRIAKVFLVASRNRGRSI